MKRRPRRRIRPDLTPLIDVIFLLLIFFLVSSMFRKDQTALELSLPEVESESAPSALQVLRIELTAEQIAVDGVPAEWEKLEARLVSLAAESQKSPVSILVDAKTPYERVAKLLDRLQLHKLKNIQLINRLQGETAENGATF